MSMLMSMNPGNFFSQEIRVNAYAYELGNIWRLEIHVNAYAQDSR